MSLFPPVRAVGGFGGGRPLKNGGGGWNAVFATADSSILNSIVLTLDPFLFINVSAGKTYAFEINAYFTANGAQDVTFSLGGTCTLTRLVAMNHRVDNTNAETTTGPNLYTPSPFTAFPAGISVNTSLNQYSGPINIKGQVIPATSGTFGLTWAQTVASAVNPTTRIAGSNMTWKQVN